MIPIRSRISEAFSRPIDDRNMKSIKQKSANELSDRPTNPKHRDPKDDPLPSDSEFEQMMLDFKEAEDWAEEELRKYPLE